MGANERQEGGEHYVSEYQHWDWVTDVGLGYLLAASTKYIARHRSKNGVEDLKKALHYFEKYCEVIYGDTGAPMEMRPRPEVVIERTERFCEANHAQPLEASIITVIATFVMCPPERWREVEAAVKGDLNKLIAGDGPKVH